MSNKACFHDVNGCIIANNCNFKDGAYYLLKPSDWRVLEGADMAHKILGENGYFNFWVTSQNSITEGLITRERLEKMFDAMRRMFRAYDEKADITEIAIVTNDIVGDDKDPRIQKLKAEVKLNAMLKLKDKYDIDMANSLGVGDRKSDISSFEEAGIGFKYQILTPFGDNESLGATDYFPSLLECVESHIKLTKGV